MKTLYDRLSKKDQELYKNSKFYELLTSESFFTELKIEDAVNIFWEKYPHLPFDYHRYEILFHEK